MRMHHTPGTAQRLGFRRVVPETADVLTEANRLYKPHGSRSTGEPADSLGCGLPCILDLGTP